MKMNVRSIVVLAALAVILLPFQNCTKAGFRGLAGTGTQKSGNGDGYTGKVYVETGMCAGKADAVVAKIQKLDELEEMEIVREACADIVPQAVAPEDLKPDPANPNHLIYKGRHFAPDRRIPEVKSVGPAGNDGGSVRVTGANLCSPGAATSFLLPMSAARDQLVFEASGIECLDGGAALEFRLPESFFNEEPAPAMALNGPNPPYVGLALTHTRVRLVNPGEEGLNSADILLKRAAYGQPVIEQFVNCSGGAPVTNSMVCVRLRGEYFGDACTVAVSLGTQEFQASVMNCSHNSAEVLIQREAFALLSNNLDARIHLHNGLRSTSRAYP